MSGRPGRRSGTEADAAAAAGLERNGDIARAALAEHGRRNLAAILARGGSARTGEAP